MSYELPFGKKSKGWVKQLVTGLPTQLHCDHEFWIAFTVFVDGDPDRDATSDNASRPNLISGMSLRPPNGSTPNLWFNPLAFGPPVPGFRGTAGRNILSGPDFKSVDFSVVKEFKFSENRKYSSAPKSSTSSTGRTSIAGNADDGEQLFTFSAPSTFTRIDTAGRIF